MADQWFYSRGGQQFGPVSAEQLKQLAASRQLAPTDLLWKEGMKDWAQARIVRGLFPQEAAATPKPPPLPPPLPDALDAERTAPRATPPPARIADDLDREATRRPPGVATAVPPLVQVRSATDLKGQVLDNFLITKRLGEGGMGVVYKATDRDTDVEYAIKVLPPALSADPRALADLKKEVANAQALTHQNLLKINYLKSFGPTTYIVMEYIDGEDLEEYRRRKAGALKLDEFRKIAPQILTGLDYLHDRGIVHLDVKPHNIMLTRNGEVKITDYGISRSIKEQLRQGDRQEPPTGTLCYMAPEQLRGGDVLDRRADVYAAGMMFLRLLTEKFPFDLKNHQAITAWHLDPRHQIHSTGTPSLDTVLRKALAVNPSERYSSCQEMLRALEAGGVLGEAPPVMGAAPVGGLTLIEQIEATRKKLQSLRARRMSSFGAWYREKFAWLITMPSLFMLFVTYAMWVCYGFLWIPAWYWIAKLTRNRKLDASLDSAIASTEAALNTLEQRQFA
jgi:serine/threonine protein kinase